MSRVDELRKARAERLTKFLAECEAEIKERRANGKSEKTCSGCVRCEQASHDNSTGWHCKMRHYSAGILPSDPACDRYWDRVEEEKRRKKQEDEWERERRERWAKNQNNPPVELKTELSYGGRILACPVCHEVAYDVEQCFNCGQKFFLGKEAQEYLEPKTKEWKCDNCGAMGIVNISKYNGHKHFHCEKCGFRWME